jgi:hypothetical protein
MNFYDIERTTRMFHNTLKKQVKEITDSLGDIHGLMKRGGYVFDPNKTRKENYETTLELHNATAGIVDGCERGDIIYIQAENADFVIFFNKKKYVDSYKNDVRPGIRIYRTYSELDVKCITKSWGVKDVESMSTKADLIIDTFTDETKHSQRIGKHVVCDRPTLKRVISDINKKEVSSYSPVYDGCDGYNPFSYELGLVHYAIRMLLVLGEELKIPDVKCY